MTDVENPWMKPGRMVVTGGTEFVGSHLVRRLLHRGHEVTVLDPSPGLTSNELRNRGAVILAGSVSDSEAVDAAVAGADLVFHLASPFGDVAAPDSVYHDTEAELRGSFVLGAGPGGPATGRCVTHSVTAAPLGATPLSRPMNLGASPWPDPPRRSTRARSVPESGLKMAGR